MLHFGTNVYSGSILVLLLIFCSGVILLYLGIFQFILVCSVPFLCLVIPILMFNNSSSVLKFYFYILEKVIVL